ncbi:hypothetical protein P3T36_002965 [Kitasatospora sp. MAP12-15]|nr:hypothetical protein [Kitasatospora sp. MAP12-44]
MTEPLMPPAVRCMRCQEDATPLPVRVGVVPTGSGPARPIWACLSCAPAVRRLLLGM